jgi:TonB family protein
MNAIRIAAIVGLVAASLVSLAAQEVYKVGNGVSAPVPIRQVKADYTQEAQAQRIEGAVTLDAVVTADGAVSDVKVAKSLDSVFGLDKAAVTAMKEWKFRPGTKDGKAVAVQVTALITFTLK